MGFDAGQDNTVPPAAMGGYEVVFADEVGAATGVDAADGLTIMPDDAAYQPALIPLGDINSDGYDDFIAAIADELESAQVPSYARVFFGSASPSDTLLTANGVTLRLPGPVLSAAVDGSRVVFASARRLQRRRRG